MEDECDKEGGTGQHEVSLRHVELSIVSIQLEIVLPILGSHKLKVIQREVSQVSGSFIKSKCTWVEVFLQPVVGPDGIDKDNENNEKRNVDDWLNDKVIHELYFLQKVEYSFPQGSEHKDWQGGSHCDH